MTTFDVKLGGHVACVTTDEQAAEEIAKAMRKHAKALYQHGECSVVASQRGYVAPEAEAPKPKPKRRRKSASAEGAGN